MRKIEWENRNKMRIDTGHKTFDAQCTLITTGNQIGSCVYSSYIRPRTETKNGAVSFQEGELQSYDLATFRNHMSQPVREFIRSITEYESVICYMFFHNYRPRLRSGMGTYLGAARRMTHGFVITTTEDKLVHVKVTGEHSAWRSRAIIDVCASYVSDEWDGNHDWVKAQQLKFRDALRSGKTRCSNDLIRNYVLQLKD